MQFVPSNIDGSSFVQLCWDNIDFNEETRTGAGTSHYTNGIAIQRVTQNLHVPQQPAVAQDDYSRRRSVPVPAHLVAEYQAGSGTRPDPQPYQQFSAHLKPYAESRPFYSHDLLYILARLGECDSELLGQDAGCAII